MEALRQILTNDIPRFARSGLCENCARRGGCSLSSMTEVPVTLCEEYDGGPDPDIIYLKPAPPTTPVEEVEKTARYLCSNCENMETCTLPSRAFGAWQCEEYV